MTGPTADEPTADEPTADEHTPADEGTAADVARRRRVFHRLLADTLGGVGHPLHRWFAVTFFVYLSSSIWRSGRSSPPVSSPGST